MKAQGESPSDQQPPLYWGFVGRNIQGIKMNNIDKTLEERGKNYGTFEGNSWTTQSIKNACRLGESWEGMTHEKKEAIEMIAHKISRIVNGDPNFKDSWVDIQGYAKLAEQSIKGV